MKEADNKVVTPLTQAMPSHVDAKGKSNVRPIVPLGSQDIHVGPQTRLSGGFNTLGMMIVDGRVDQADIDADRLVVSHIGELRGRANVHRAEISGVFDGELVAGDEVIVRPTARIAGVVRCQRLVIHRGARIECSFSCDPEETDAPAASNDASQRGRVVPARKLTRDRRSFLAGVATVFAVFGAVAMLNTLRTMLLS